MPKTWFQALWFRLAQFVLGLLVLIHWILPFTPVNQHPEPHIKVASVAFGLIFLATAVASIYKPTGALIFGLSFLLSLYIVSALTGASPPEEGWVVKLMFVVLLMGGIISNILGANAKPSSID